MAEEKVNMHDDHEATCFCCWNCSLSYEGDHSCYTPGAGFVFECWKGHYYYRNREVNIHEIALRGRTCEDFTTERPPQP
jgi:hypothetical protein